MCVFRHNRTSPWCNTGTANCSLDCTVLWKVGCFVFFSHTSNIMPLCPYTSFSDGWSGCSLDKYLQMRSTLTLFKRQQLKMLFPEWILKSYFFYFSEVLHVLNMWRISSQDFTGSSKQYYLPIAVIAAASGKSYSSIFYQTFPLLFLEKKQK